MKRVYDCITKICFGNDILIHQLFNVQNINVCYEYICLHLNIFTCFEIFVVTKMLFWRIIMGIIFWFTTWKLTNKYNFLSLCHSNVKYSPRCWKITVAREKRKPFNICYYCLLIECNCRGLLWIYKPVDCFWICFYFNRCLIKCALQVFRVSKYLYETFLLM